jgi:bisphosphoglycerate-independent phosphoglycerate mutase (AlkP superfamily)
LNKGTEEDFEDLGMRLKKNNVSLDVINFANPDNVGRLEAMVNCANDGSEDAPTCHFLDVP